jgi:putative peptidoglycan lipid II flippase
VTGSGLRAAVRGLAGAAVLIAVLTVLSRVVGFGRVLVFSQTVGATCLGTAYQTANQVPNILFEVVAGGALASVVVPVLAGAFARGDVREAARNASALLSWALLVLIPVALLAALGARPVAAALLQSPRGCPTSDLVDVATRMLLVFLPQVPLYGAAVVFSGILQADRRFLAAALAPLLSSVVVAASYIVFAASTDADLDDVASVPLASQFVLAGGTTLGVLVLAGCLVPALARTGVALRPTLRFTSGTATRVRALAAAGLVTLLAQQASVVVVVMLANGRGGPGAIVLYGYAWTIYLLPYAVLAVPIATSAFPHLSAAVAATDDNRFADVTARTTRAVVLATAAGAAMLAGAALPIAEVFVAGPGSGDPTPLALALTAFAPGLLGYGLVTHLGRALYAQGRGRLAATCTALGWVIVIVADLVLVQVLPPEYTVVALGLGNTVGMLVAGALLAIGVRRAAGPAALGGLPRALAAAVLGGGLGAVAGVAMSSLLDAATARTVWSSLLAGIVSVAAALVGYLCVTLVVDRADARDLIALLRRRRSAESE